MKFDSKLAKQPGSDEWWIKRLAQGIAERRPHVDELQSWLDGCPPAAWVLDDKDKQEAYHRIIGMARLNLAELIVSSTLYRVQVETVRTGVDSDVNGDDVVNQLMLASDATAQFRQALEWMLALSCSYLYVRQVAVDDHLEGRITAEHPNEVNAEADPLDPTKNTAAIKMYRDDANNRDVLVLFRPGYQRTAYKYGRTVLPRNRHVSGLSDFVWADDFSDSEYLGRENVEYEEVPIFTLMNRFGVGEFEKHLAHMQRINQTIFQMMVMIAVQAFKQRAVSGVPNTDPQGNPINYDEIFSADPGSLWIMPEAAKVWESGALDFTPITNAIQKDVERLAVAAQAPLYALSSDAAQQSAESAALMREGQVFKAEDLQKRLTPRIAAAVSCMLRLSGEYERADRRKMRVLWAPARRSSLSERAQAALSAKQAGVPLQMVGEKFLELSPAEVQEMLAQRDADALAAQVAVTQAQTLQP